MIPLANLSRQFQSIKHEVLWELEGLIESGAYILGSQVDRLERRIAETIGVTEAIGVGNGTDALILALEALGIGQGDEVITTPYTFIATAEAISRVGAKPVFVDIDSQTYNLDPTRVERAITANTKAILPVHLFGQPADMEELTALARQYGLFVIEDACQAFGALYQGKPAGSLSDAACFSFFPTKNLGTMGDGGMVVTSNRDISCKVRKLRQHGSSKKYYHDLLGHNSRLDELHAVILNVSLNYIDEWNERRRALAERYRTALADLPYLKLPYEKSGRTHGYHQFCVESQEREAMIDTLHRHGIQTAVYYPCPLHLQPAYAHLSYREGDFPVAEQISARLFALPMGPFLQESEQDAIISVLRSCRGESP